MSVSSNANSCQCVSVCLKSSSKTCPLYYQTSSLQLCSPFSHTQRDNLKILPPLCKCKVQKCPPKKQNQLGITLRNHTTFHLTFTPHIIFLTKSLPPKICFYRGRYNNTMSNVLKTLNNDFFKRFKKLKIRKQIEQQAHPFVIKRLSLLGIY